MSFRGPRYANEASRKSNTFDWTRVWAVMTLVGLQRSSIMFFFFSLSQNHPESRFTFGHHAPFLDRQVFDRAHTDRYFHGASWHTLLVVLARPSGPYRVPSRFGSLHKDRWCAIGWTSAQRFGSAGARVGQEMTRSNLGTRKIMCWVIFIFYLFQSDLFSSFTVNGVMLS